MSAENNNSNVDGAIEVDTSDLGASKSPAFTPEQQEYIGRIAAKARAQGRGERQQPRDDTGTFSSESKQDRQNRKAQAQAELVASTVAATLKGMGIAPQAPTETEWRSRGVAAAPNAPSKVDPITSQGLVDIFNLSAPQLQQLGPQGLRAEYEKILSVGRSQAGAPRPPTPGAKRR